MFEELTKHLHARGIADTLIEQVFDSGYFCKGLATAGGQGHYTVSDALYGNKMSSSSFELDDFVRHLQGEPAFQSLPPLRRIRVRNRRELYDLLSDPRLHRYQSEGSLTLRGQPREHHLRRAIPSPVRADNDGKEVSILPGLYRQTTPVYSAQAPMDERRTIDWFRREIETEAEEDFQGPFSRDFMHVEQHYARQTAGLDLTFDMESALFFATNKFTRLADGRAQYNAVCRGEHQGVIYLFRFGSPSVGRTEFLIGSFDYFRTNQPLRVIRQVCGLPYFSRFERNLAVTDVDTVIELDADFADTSAYSVNYMFPDALEDRFYGRLLAVKDRFPDALTDVVEYAWARPAAPTQPE